MTSQFKLFKLCFFQFIVIVVLLFINSPAFSIIALVSGFYFPNEKLALLIVLFSLYIKKNLNLNNSWVVYVCPGILILVIGLRAIFYQEPVYRADINLVLMLLTIPLYTKFFKKNENFFFKGLHIVTAIQIIIAGYQWLMLINGNYNQAMIFFNFLPERPTSYPMIFPGIYRVGGLFIESSQLAIYLSFYFIFFSFYKKGKHQINWLSSLCFLANILTFSMTGYLIIISYLMIKVIKSNKYKIICIALILLFSLALPLIYDSWIWDYLNLRLNTNIEGGERFGSFLYYLNMAETRIFTGYGASWENPDRYDFLSVYLYSYGIFGCLAVLTYVLNMLKGLDLVFYAFLVVAFSTNAAIMMPAYIVVFSCLAILKSQKQPINYQNILMLKIKS